MTNDAMTDIVIFMAGIALFGLVMLAMDRYSGKRSK